MLNKSYSRIISAPKDRSFFLFGPRGSGKSTWLKENFEAALYIDLLDQRTFHNYLTSPELFGQRLNALPKDSRVIVDEIQRLPDLLNEVHRFIEKSRLRFILCGSSARKLRKEGTNLLAGRAILREMFPLVPEELGTDFSLAKILQYGSLPIIWQSHGDRDVLEAYVQTYLREEIQAEALVRNLQGFARFLPIASLFHSQVLNVSTLARDSGVARTSIAGYLNILEDTLLAFRLNAFEGKLRVKEKTHPKLYWIDPGVARAARRRYGELHDEERGALFEGWIASLLRSYRSYKHLFDEWNYWSPTETDTMEVDFLLWKDDVCVAIEVKASQRPRSEFFKGLRALKEGMRKHQLKKSILVYLGEDRLRTEDGIDVLPLSDFLVQLQNATLFS